MVLDVLSLVAAVQAVDHMAAAWSILTLRGPFALGAELAPRVAEAAGLPPDVAARACRLAGWALRFWGALERSRGFQERGLGLEQATAGLAAGRVLRAGEGAAELEHGGELRFGFLLHGVGELRLEDRRERLGPGDAFSLPAGIPASWSPEGAEARLLLIELR